MSKIRELRRNFLRCLDKGTIMFCVYILSIITPFSLITTRVDFFSNEDVKFKSNYYYYLIIIKGINLISDKCHSSRSEWEFQIVICILHRCIKKVLIIEHKRSPFLKYQSAKISSFYRFIRANFKIKIHKHNSTNRNYQQISIWDGIKSQAHLMCSVVILSMPKTNCQNKMKSFILLKLSIFFITYVRSDTSNVSISGIFSI